jgi:arylsulfatase A-like enzyme
MRYVLVAFSILILTASFCDAQQQKARPNIVIILADDLGYSDLGCFGGEIHTPNVDALAAKGLSFTEFYNCGRCCPSRASLMSGLYPHQAGVGRMTSDTGKSGYRGYLTENTVTIAEVLRAAGYRTGMVGKWHLSVTKEGPGHIRHLNNQEILDRFADLSTYPVGRGFEEHYGIIWGVANYFDPFSLVHNTEPVRSVPKDYYLTDALSEHALEMIDKYGKGPEPFFLYVAYTSPHWPLHGLAQEIAKYEQTYKVGWDAIREARHRRMLEKGIVPAGSRLGPRSDTGGSWEQNPTKDWDARAMAVHAAMIDRMDQGVGKIVAKLSQMKLLDNTLILFLSDNGASPENYPNPGFDRPSQTRDGRKIAYPPQKTVMAGADDTWFYIGPAWASVANTPLRYWKAEMHEGGICTPLIMYWPAGLKTPAGSLTRQVGHVMDVMATCLELSGANYPKDFKDHPITPLEGISLAPIIRNERWVAHEELAWEHFGARAIRVGDWKLVARKGGAWELYNIAKDRGESENRAADEPEKLREMEERWERWAKRTNVFPTPDAPAQPKP